MIEELREKTAGLSNNKVNKTSVASVPPTVEGVEVFRAFIKAGQRLAEIHVHGGRANFKTHLKSEPLYLHFESHPEKLVFIRGYIDYD